MILPLVRARLVTAFTAQLPDVQISPVPPGENMASKDSVWIQSARSTFDWRSIGSNPRNRIESLEVEVRVHVYRENPNQATAAESAMGRCEEILEKLEDAIEADFSLNDSFSFGLNREVAVELEPRQSGWAAVGTYRLEAQNYPA